MDSAFGGDAFRQRAIALAQQTAAAYASNGSTQHAHSRTTSSSTTPSRVRTRMPASGGTPQRTVLSVDHSIAQSTIRRPPPPPPLSSLTTVNAATPSSIDGGTSSHSLLTRLQTQLDDMRNGTTPSSTTPPPPQQLPRRGRWSVDGGEGAPPCSSSTLERVGEARNFFSSTSTTPTGSSKMNYYEGRQRSVVNPHHASLQMRGMLGHHVAAAAGPTVIGVPQSTIPAGHVAAADHSTPLLLRVGGSSALPSNVPTHGDSHRVEAYRAPVDGTQRHLDPNPNLHDRNGRRDAGERHDDSMQWRTDSPPHRRDPQHRLQQQQPPPPYVVPSREESVPLLSPESDDKRRSRSSDRVDTHIDQGWDGGHRLVNPSPLFPTDSSLDATQRPVKTHNLPGAAQATPAPAGIAAAGPASRVVQAITQRILDLEASVTALQGSQVRRHATVSVEVDKAKRAVDHSEYRLTELSANLDASSVALMERIQSRVKTQVQLRENQADQWRSTMLNSVREIPTVIRREAARSVSGGVVANINDIQIKVDTLMTALEQFSTQNELRTTSMMHRFMDVQRRVRDRINAVRVASSAVTSNNNNSNEAFFSYRRPTDITSESAGVISPLRSRLGLAPLPTTTAATDGLELGGSLDGPAAPSVVQHSTKTLQSMQRMLHQFVQQTRSQLDELRRDRRVFEEHFIARVAAMSAPNPSASVEQAW